MFSSECPDLEIDSENAPNVVTYFDARWLKLYELVGWGCPRWRGRVAPATLPHQPLFP